MIQKVKKRKIKFKRMVVASISIIISLIVTIIFIYNGLKGYNRKEVKNISNVIRNLDYKVNLNQNNFIDKEYLEKGQNYISDLVKSIDTNFEYSLVSSTMLGLKYSYDIKATIYGEYKLSANDSYNTIWEKEIPIIESKTLESEKENYIYIKETPQLDFIMYNNMVSEFRKKLQIPLNAYLNVEMHVTTFFVDQNNEKIIEDDSKIKMKIPLNLQAFSISEEYEEKSSHNTYFEKSEIEYRFIILGIASFMFGLVIFINNMKFIFRFRQKTKYRQKVDKILKAYKEIIIEVLSPIDKTNKTVIKVKNFNEIVFLEEELRTPIMFYESVERDVFNYDEATFTILKDNMLYEFVVKGDNENKIELNITDKKNLKYFNKNKESNPKHFK